jgi:hypothetical protein
MKYHFLPSAKLIVAIIICFIFIVNNSLAQSKDENAIRLLMQKQENAWNNGNLNDFMKGYWVSDSLMFIGKSGITYGWQKTLDNYKKGYPDTSVMGKLTFTLLHIKRLDKINYFVVGKWHLKRSIGDAGGYFTLWFKKIKGQWYIVADHTS